jgi:hypothetical protein
VKAQSVRSAGGRETIGKPLWQPDHLVVWVDGRADPRVQRPQVDRRRVAQRVLHGRALGLCIERTQAINVVAELANQQAALRQEAAGRAQGEAQFFCGIAKLIVRLL